MSAKSFTDLIGCSVPLQLAAMPGVCTPQLVSAVCNAGGLGMFGAPRLDSAALERIVLGISARTRGPFGVNFLMPFLDLDCVRAVASSVRVVEFFYGQPQKSLVDVVHEGGALAGWQVGSLAEACSAEEAGCDYVIAQGTAAGGHVRGEISLLPLLSLVIESIKVPVIAAGGIATARDVKAVMAAGASAVRIGTRFVAAAESGAHPEYVARLIAANAEDTVLTEAFSVLWPDAPHRVLRSCIDAATRFEGEFVGETAWGSDRIPVPRFSSLVATRDTTGAIDAMCLYAGESVHAVQRVQSAATIVHELMPWTSTAQRPIPIH